MADLAPAGRRMRGEGAAAPRPRALLPWSSLRPIRSGPTKLGLVVSVVWREREEMAEIIAALQPSSRRKQVNVLTGSPSPIVLPAKKSDQIAIWCDVATKLFSMEINSIKTPCRLCIL
jgi:hypothetical protein